MRAKCLERFQVENITSADNYNFALIALGQLRLEWIAICLALKMSDADFYPDWMKRWPFLFHPWFCVHVFVCLYYSIFVTYLCVCMRVSVGKENESFATEEKCAWRLEVATELRQYSYNVRTFNSNSSSEDYVALTQFFFLLLFDWSFHLR